MRSVPLRLSAWRRAGIAFSLAVCTSVAGTTAAFAEPPQGPSAQCTGGGITGHAFTQSPPGRADYHFSGACITRDGSALAYRVDGSWTGTSGDPGLANAVEIYHVDRVSGRSQSYIGIVGFRCPEDPWLSDVDCTRVGASLPDEIDQFWRQLAAGGTPTSRRGLPRDQRAALLDAYRRANGQRVVTDHAAAVDAPRGALQGTAITPAMPAHRRIDDTVILTPQPSASVDVHPVTATQRATPERDDGSAAGIIIVGGTPASLRTRRDATDETRTVVPQTQGARP